MTRTRMLAAALLAGSALLAAGCGSDNSQASASTQWADGVCSAVKTWQSDLESSVGTLTSTPSRDGLQKAAEDAKSATKTLVDTVKGLGTPDTDAGKEARSTVDTLTTELSSDVDTIQTALDGVSGVQGVLNAVSAVSATLAKMSSQLTTSLGDLSSLRNVDDQLRQSFEDAKSCDGLLPSGS